MKVPGKGLLLSAGILLIVYGSLAMLLSLFITAGAMLLAAIFGAIFKGFTQAFGNALLPLMLAGAGLGAVDLALGIAGLKLSAKPAGVVFFFVSAAALCLLHAGYVAYMGPKSSFFLYFGLLGLAFAAMYMAGGLMKRRAAAAARGAGL
jgi:hypothetical protein